MTDVPTLLQHKLLFVDVTATGTDPHRDSITSVNTLELAHGQFIQMWSQMVHPGTRIPTAAAEYSGVSDASVKHAPQFSDCADRVRMQLRQGEVYVAHYGLRYDLVMLRHHFGRVEHLPHPTLDTWVWAKHLCPSLNAHGLRPLAERFDLLNAADRAAVASAPMRDCLMTAALLMYLATNYPALGELTLAQALTKQDRILSAF